MDHLLKFLIYEIKTIDGKKDSGFGLQQHLIEKRTDKSSSQSSWRSQQIVEIVKHQIMKKTLTKYSILRIRQKISFMAFMKKMTVLEMIMESVLRTHDLFVQEESIPLYDPLLLEKHEIFNKILFDEQPTAFMAIMKINTLSHDNDSETQ